MGIGFESGISQSVGSSVGGLQGGARFLTPPSGIPIPPEPLPPVPAGIAAGALSLLAPVAAFFGAFFLFPGAAGDPNESKAVQNFNAGQRQTSTPPPFIGGQSPVLYRVQFKQIDLITGEVITRTATLQGAIGAAFDDFDVRQDSFGAMRGYQYQGFTYNNGAIFVWRDGFISGSAASSRIKPNSFTIVDVQRVDGLPDIGNLPTPTIFTPSGYTGTNGVTPEEKAKKILPAKIASTLGASGAKSFGAVGGGSPSLSGGRNYTPSDLWNYTPSDLLSRITPESPSLAPPPRSPIQDPPTTPPIQKPTPRLDKPKAPLDPLKPYEPNPSDVTGQLASIGSILGLMKGDVTDIKNNTTPENQKANAKAGSCEAMNSPSCTQGFEGRIKDPINQNINDKTGALNTLLSSLNTGLSAFIAAATTNFGKILSILDNQYIDRALGVVNTALNLHNALMLSSALGKTAAGIVDNVINLNPSWRFVDSKGQQTTASRVFGQNIEAFFINIIGLENYTNLQDFLAVENRIIRSSTNLLNRTESLFAKSAKVGQKLGADIGDLSNAMLVNGVISPSSYPKKAASKAANDALDSDTASDISSAASGVSSTLKNLKTITGEVLTVTRNAQKISTEFTKLTALFNADSKVRKDLRIQIATKAKKRSIYTIVDIKQIKINADKRPNSKPLR